MRMSRRGRGIRARTRTREDGRLVAGVAAEGDAKTRPTVGVDERGQEGRQRTLARDRQVSLTHKQRRGQVWVTE